MTVVWHERKRRRNIAEHQVDFAIAAEIFEGNYVQAQDPREYQEPHFIALGEFEGRNYVVVFTWREESWRIISAWRVGDGGKRRYQKLLARGSAGDEGSG